MYRQIKSLFHHKPRWVVFASGAILPLSFAPFNFLPIACLSYYVFWKHIMRAKTWRNAFVTGWLFGFGQFVFGLYWISNAVLVEADTFWWLVPFALLGFPACLAIFIALPSVLWFGLREKIGPNRYLLNAVCLAGLLAFGEFARGTVLTGFPWNNIAMTWGSWLWLSQNIVWSGFYGLSFIVLLWLIAPASLWAQGRRMQAISLSSGVLLIAISFGIWRIETEPEITQGPRIAIVQPHVEQDRKLRQQDRQDILQELLSLTAQAVQAKADYIIWPETAVPYLIDEDPNFGRLLEGIMPEASVLITGAIRRQKTMEAVGDDAPLYDYYNSAQLWSGVGSLLDVSDKKHLVPFGEYLPFQEYLERFGFQQLTRLRGGFTPGTKESVLASDAGIKFMPLICYEAIFPLNNEASKKIDILLNLTNDAWFGISVGPYQHLAQSRLRAIEAKRPLIRAANTGVSIVFDHMGREIDRMGLGQKGILIVSLPLAKHE